METGIMRIIVNNYKDTPTNINQWNIIKRFNDEVEPQTVSIDYGDKTFSLRLNPNPILNIYRRDDAGDPKDLIGSVPIDEFIDK